MNHQTPEQVELTVKRILSAQSDVPVDKLTHDMHLAHDLGLDSLDMVELEMALEDEFSIRIYADTDLQSVTTVQTLIDAMRNKVNL